MIKRYVLEGASYTGKTEVCKALMRTRKGFKYVPEIARMIIRLEQRKGTTCLPWIDRRAFEVKCLKKAIESYSTFKEGIVFFDRGVVDGVAYHKMYGKCPGYVKAAKEYRYDKIFLLEMVPGYEKDEIRKFDLETEKKIQELIEESCLELGYDVVHIPVIPAEDSSPEAEKRAVQERANLILKHLGL